MSYLVLQTGALSSCAITPVLPQGSLMPQGMQGSLVVSCMRLFIVKKFSTPKFLNKIANHSKNVKMWGHGPAVPACRTSKVGGPSTSGSGFSPWACRWQEMGRH